jgi:hypothetical protein
MPVPRHPGYWSFEQCRWLEDDDRVAPAAAPGGTAALADREPVVPEPRSSDESPATIPSVPVSAD